MKKYQDNAALIKSESALEKRSVRLISRPLKIAFLVREDLALRKVKTLISYLSSIWGGYYNLLAPTDGYQIEDYWWNNLHQFEPDVIIACVNVKSETISDELYDEIRRDLHFIDFKIWEVWDNIEKLYEYHRRGASDNFADAVPLAGLLRYSTRDLNVPLDPEKSNFRIPVFTDYSGREDFLLCLMSMTGNFEGFYADFVRNVLGARSLEFEDDKKLRLDLLREFEEKISPLGYAGSAMMSRISHSLGSGWWPDGLSIIFTGNRFVSDLCIYWASRLRFSLRGAGTFRSLIFPIDYFRSSKRLDEFVDEIKNDNYWFQNQMSIISTSAGSRRLKRIQERFNKNRSLWARIVSPGDISRITVYESAVAGEIWYKGNKFEINLPQSNVNEFAGAGRWVVDAKLGWPYEFPQSSKLLDLVNPSVDKLKWTDLKVSEPGFSLIASPKKSTSSGEIPIPVAPFEAYFDDRGYSLSLTEKHAFAEGTIALLDNLLKLVEKENVRTFFWGLSDGKSHDLRGIRSLLKGGANGDEIINSFVQKRILLRGLAFTCENCGLRRWYPLAELDETITCTGCLEVVMPPSQSNIHYRLNELVSRAVRQGSLPVILTRRILFDTYKRNSLWLYGAEIFKGDARTDIDLLTTWRGQVIAVECKDFKKGVLKKEERKLKLQIRELRDLCEDTNIRMLVLSTLLDKDSGTFSDLANFVLGLNNKSSKVSINLLSLTSLGFVFLDSPTELVENPEIGYPLLKTN